MRKLELTKKQNWFEANGQKVFCFTELGMKVLATFEFVSHQTDAETLLFMEKRFPKLQE
jgi:hypothetical protein